MTKSEIIRRLHEKYPHLSLLDLQELVDMILTEVSEAIVDNRRVEIRGFGAFSLRKRPARKARNPRSGETIDLKERYLPYFRAGKDLKDTVNG